MGCFLCLFMPPTLVKFEGHVAFCLAVSVWPCVLGWVFAGWGVCQLGGAEMWLAGSVSHFFETFNGE